MERSATKGKPSKGLPNIQQVARIAEVASGKEIVNFRKPEALDELKGRFGVSSGRERTTSVVRSSDDPELDLFLRSKRSAVQ